MNTAMDVASMSAARDTRLSPPLRGRGGEGGITNSGVCGLPPTLTLPRKGGGNGEKEAGHDEFVTYGSWS